MEIEGKSLRTAVRVFQARTSRKGLKEGRVTLRYLAVLPSRGLNARGSFSTGARGTRQWEKGLEGQCSEVKRGPQHFHDFPRLIVMHGAHPGRLAFKLRDLCLLLLSLVRSSAPSFSVFFFAVLATRAFPFSLAKCRRTAPVLHFFSYVTEPHVPLLLLLLLLLLAATFFSSLLFSPLLFYLFSQRRDKRTRTCFRALARGTLSPSERNRHRLGHGPTVCASFRNNRDSLTLDQAEFWTRKENSY